MTRFTHVIKRSGAKVPFTPNRITNAIYRAAVAVGGRDKKIAEKLASQVIKYMEESVSENWITRLTRLAQPVRQCDQERILLPCTTGIKSENCRGRHRCILE